MTMGVDLWQTAATSWIVAYNELVKNASTITEYWFNLFQSPSSRIKDKEDKVSLECHQTIYNGIGKYTGLMGKYFYALNERKECCH